MTSADIDSHFAIDRQFLHTHCDIHSLRHTFVLSTFCTYRDIYMYRILVLKFSIIFIFLIPQINEASKNNNYPKSLQMKFLCHILFDVIMLVTINKTLVYSYFGKYACIYVCV